MNKNHLVVLSLLSLASTANAAGSMTEALSEAQFCDMVAFGAKMSYQAHQNGEKVPDYPYKSAVTPLMKFAKDYGQTAVSEDDAYNVTMGKCLDNIGRLHRDFKASGKVHDTLPY